MAEPLGRGRRHKKQSQKLRESLGSDHSDNDATSSTTANMVSPKSAAAKKRKSWTSHTVECDGDEYTLPPFEDISTLVYDWPTPRPDFSHASILPLSVRHRLFKYRDDAGQKAQWSTEPPLDEWRMFESNFQRGQGDCENNAKTFKIAFSVFVTRARRAYFAKKSWAQYEKKELEAETFEDSLPNKIRLAIFDRLKRRLCEELWMQPYPGASDSRVPTPELEEQRIPVVSARSPAGGATDTVAHSSKRTRSGRAAVATDTAGSVYASNIDTRSIGSRTTPSDPTASESCITGWHSDRFGVPQPTYENEAAPPNMDGLIAASRCDRAADMVALQQGLISMARMRDQMQHTNINGVYGASRPNFLPSFETSVEMNQLDMDTSDEE